MQIIDRLDEREALYAIRKKSLGIEEFSELFRALNKLNGEVVDFRYHYFGNLLSSKKRVFSIRNLDSKSCEGRKEKSILMATIPSKKKGFFIPWGPYPERTTPEIIQLLSRSNLIFEILF